MTNKYNNWIDRTLDVDLAVNGNGDVDVVVTDNESSSYGKFTFIQKDTMEEIIQRIGTEIYSWIELMRDEVEEEEN